MNWLVGGAALLTETLLHFASLNLLFFTQHYNILQYEPNKSVFMLTVGNLHVYLSKLPLLGSGSLLRHRCWREVAVVHQPPSLLR